MTNGLGHNEGFFQASLHAETHARPLFVKARQPLRVQRNLMCCGLQLRRRLTCRQSEVPCPVTIFALAS